MWVAADLPPGTTGPGLAKPCGTSETQTFMRPLAAEDVITGRALQVEHFTVSGTADFVRQMHFYEVYSEVILLYNISFRISGSFKIFSNWFIIKAVYCRSIKKFN